MSLNYSRGALSTEELYIPYFFAERYLNKREARKNTALFDHSFEFTDGKDQRHALN